MNPADGALLRPVSVATIVYAIIDLRSSRDHPLRDAIETFIRRDDGERFIDELPGDDR